MNDRVKIALLLTGTVLGFGSGFASLAWRHAHGWGPHHGCDRGERPGAVEHGRDDGPCHRDRERGH